MTLSLSTSLVLVFMVPSADGGTFTSTTSTPSAGAELSREVCLATTPPRAVWLQCHDACANSGPPSWCVDFCKDPNTACYEDGSNFCPEFRPTWSVALIGGVSGQFHEWQGAAGTLKVRAGRHFSPQLHGYVQASAGAGYGNREEGIIPVQTGFGAELFLFDVLTLESVLALGAGATYLWPNALCDSPSGACPQGPGLELAVRHLPVAPGGDPYYRGFQSWSWELTGTAAYDPSRDVVIYRIGLGFGFELYFAGQ